MKIFHRTNRDSKINGFIGLSFCLFLSVVFMSLGFHSLAEGEWSSFEVVFGVAGMAVFVIFIRGAWMMSGGSLTHVFSIDREKVIWGFIGKEKELNISEVKTIYWNDSDGFTMNMSKYDGSIIRFPYIETVVSYKSKGELLKFLRTTLSAIPIDGHVASEPNKSP